MPNLHKNKVIYGNTVLIDITDTTAVAADVAAGKYFYLASGEKVEGTASTGGGMTVVETQDSHGGTIVTITGEEIILQSKSATPTTSSQTIQPDEGYTGLSQVLVGAIPSQYIIPTGTKSITANGTGIDVAQYESVDVAVPSSSPNLQTKTNISPTTSSQTISPDSGYDGLSSVQINAMPSGSATAPSTISATDASISSQTGKITLTKYAVSVTPVVTAGYISSGTEGKSTVSVTANVTTKGAATITPTKSTQTISSGTYLTGTQTIAAIPSAYQDVTSVTAAAGDVVSGKTIVDSTGATVNGSLVIQHYYTGSGTPSSSLGQDGDIYLQTS